MTFTFSWQQVITAAAVIAAFKTIWSVIDAAVKKWQAPNKEQDSRLEDHEKRIAALEAESNDSREAINLLLTSILVLLPDCDTKTRVNEYLINRRFSK